MVSERLNRKKEGLITVKKRILFVNAINPAVEVEQRYPNIGLGYLISVIRRHFGGKAFDFKVVSKNIAHEILNYQPDLMGITSVSQNYNYAKQYARLAKSKRLPVIIGGVHISALPHSLSRDMDVGCLGEGERTIIELLELFREENSFPAHKLRDITGIVYWEDKDLTIGSNRKLIKDIDTIPFPARDLLRIDKHSYVFSSRGCPYRCTFCASSLFWDKLRFFSAEYVVAEIKELVERYGVRLISFYDDLFIANKKRLIEIVNLLKKKDFSENIKFTCSCRANLLTDDIARLLKEMNVVSVGMGLESGCERILKYLKGEKATVDNNRNAVKILRKHGIAANASFIIGSPDEREEEIMETYRFIKENPLNLVDIYTLTPYPGTPVWNYAIERGMVSDDMDWSRLNINFESSYKEAIILSETLSRERLYTIYRKFRRQRFLRNLRNVWTHPFIMDVPRMIPKIIMEKAARLKRSVYEND